MFHLAALTSDFKEKKTMGPVSQQIVTEQLLDIWAPGEGPLPAVGGQPRTNNSNNSYLLLTTYLL